MEGTILERLSLHADASFSVWEEGWLLIFYTIPFDRGEQKNINSQGQV